MAGMGRELPSYTCTNAHRGEGNELQEYIKERCRSIGNYLVETGCTVRQAAVKFGVSKSSVHKDATERLPAVDAALAQQVRQVLAVNKAQRHIRGGQATMRKYHPEESQS